MSTLAEEFRGFDEIPQASPHPPAAIRLSKHKKKRVRKHSSAEIHATATNDVIKVGGFVTPSTSTTSSLISGVASNSTYTSSSLATTIAKFPDGWLPSAEKTFSGAKQQARPKKQVNQTAKDVALQQACSCGHVQVAEMLLETGAHVDGGSVLKNMGKFVHTLVNVCVCIYRYVYSLHHRMHRLHYHYLIPAYREYRIRAL